MELTARDFDRIPRENVHVRVSEFARLWWAAERRADALEAEGLAEDSYLTGVQSTCRWIAGAIITVNGLSGPVCVWAASPITGVQEKAYQELIAEETLAAERAVIGSPPGRPGFVDGALATLAWAWRRSGVPPIEVEQAHTG